MRVKYLVLVCSVEFLEHFLKIEAKSVMRGLYVPSVRFFLFFFLNVNRLFSIYWREISRSDHCRRNMTFKAGGIKAGMASDIHELLFRRKVFVGQLIKRLSLTFYWISPLCSFSGSAQINPSPWSRRLQFAGRAELLTCWIANETLRRCCSNHPDSDRARNMNNVVFFSESVPAGSTLTHDFCCRYFSSELVPLTLHLDLRNDSQ